MTSRPRRIRPALPYRPISARKLQMNCRRALRRLGIRGPRAYELMAILVELAPQLQSGVVFKGDLGMAKLMDRCAKTVHRGKYDLLRAGVIRLHCAGPRMCPCRGCGGAAAGGKILNANGQAVSAATGYEFDPSVLRQAKNPSRQVEAASYAPPARGQAERFRGLSDQLGGRPGP